MKLTKNANLTHETAQEWYESYGWYMFTKNEWEVELQEVEFEWLEDGEDVAVQNLMVAKPGLLQEEAEGIVAKAAEVREAAEEVESWLVEAVTAYRNNDLQGTIDALSRARLLEILHGDAPASNSLRSELLEDEDEDEDEDECECECECEE